MNKIFADENFKSVDDAGNILVSRRNKTAKTSSNVAETNPKSRLTLNMWKQEQNEGKKFQPFLQVSPQSWCVHSF